MSNADRKRPGKDMRDATELARAVLRNQTTEAHFLARKILDRDNRHRETDKPK